MSFVGRLAVVLSAALFAGLAAAQEVGAIAPRFLLDPAKPAAAQQVTPSNDKQASVKFDASGMDVTIAAGEAGYPGVTVKPESGPAWDLAAYGRVEAKITNTGKGQLSIGLRIDNAGDWSKEPTNTEGATLKPGESKIVKVIFGHSYGFKPAFKLDPSAVIQVLLFANGKSAEERSFRVEELKATGSAGEKPPVDPNTVKTRPENGVIFGAQTKVDPAKQVVAKDAKAEAASGVIRVQSNDKKEGSVTIKPAIGSWDLTDYFQVTVKVKNTGTAAITPKVRVGSKSGATGTITADSIAPGAEAQITVPFAPAVSAVIPTDAKQETAGVVGKGTWSEHNWGPKEGTSTKFGSMWVTGVTISATGTMEVLGIMASAPTASLPEWVGKRPPVDGDWVMTLKEEFEGDAIDFKRWNIYTHNYWDKRTHFSKDNVHVRDGKLVLTYEKKTGWHNDDPNYKKTVTKTDYTSGFADSYAKWVQKYGYFEARMKLPKAPGLWPAFWMMPDRGPGNGDMGWRSSIGKGGMEFDICEFLSGWGPYRYNMAMHWDGYGKEHKSAGTGYHYFVPDKDGFVTAGLLWTPGAAVFYSQGQEVLRWESPRVCSIPSYMIFTFVSGGWDNLPLEDSKLPDDLVIDYVRVWQRKDLASPTDGPQENKGLPSSLDPELDM